MSLVDAVVEKTRQLTKIPVLLQVAATINSDTSAVQLQTTWHQNVVETSESVKFERSFLLDLPTLKLIYKSSPQPIGKNFLVCHSPSQKHKAIFRQKEGDGKEEKWLVEIWSDEHLSAVVDLAAIDEHGPVYVNGDLSSFEWSPDESRLLFMAEKKRPTATSYFDDHPVTGAEKGAESRWYMDWGEQMTGQHLPVLVVLNVRKTSLAILQPAGDQSLGQARWRLHEGRASVVAIAWENTPRRLGLIYCTNRPSHVLELKPDGGSERCLSSATATHACRSPRVSPDGTTVVWLEAAAGGPHHKGCRLMRWSADRPHEPAAVVLDLVDVPNDDGYPGLYLMQLPARCWLSHHHICLSTPQGTSVSTHVVDVHTGERRTLGDRDVTVLHACAHVMVGVRSSLLLPPQLVVCRSDSDGQFSAITDSQPVSDARVVPVEFYRDQPVALATQPYTGLLVLPESAAAPAPLVLFPHGGPHSVTTDTWSTHVALFAQLGLAVLLLNYRGSAGAGERSLHALPGHIGQMDVRDCEHAAREVLSKNAATLDAARVGAYGGSHGGFLVTHLSGQHPDMVRAVVARNPVCDISAKLEGTDIPDWSYVETGGQFAAVPTSDQLATMLLCSPMAHAASVRAPTLLLLGRDDRRVPEYQALAFHQALRSRGIETEVRSYDDCHTLAKPGVNGDVMVHSAVWLCRKLNHDPTV